MLTVASSSTANPRIAIVLAAAYYIHVLQQAGQQQKQQQQQLQPAAAYSVLTSSSTLLILLCYYASIRVCLLIQLDWQPLHLAARAPSQTVYSGRGTGLTQWPLTIIVSFTS